MVSYWFMNTDANSNPEDIQNQIWHPIQPKK